MGKSLGDKLWEKAGKVRKSIRNYVLLGTAVASLGLGSCKFPCPNYPPEAILQVSNTSDNNYNLNLSGTDKNGDYDITEYEVSIDEGDNGTIEEVVNQSSPININRMFNENTRIYGQVTDSQNATNKKEQLIKKKKLESEKQHILDSSKGYSVWKIQLN